MWNLTYHQYQHNGLKSGYRKRLNVLGFGWCSIPVAVVDFILDVLQPMHAKLIYIYIFHFRTSSALEPGLNLNWTSQTHSGSFGPRFCQMAKPEPAFSSVFINFAEELD